MHYKSGDVNPLYFNFLNVLQLFGTIIILYLSDKRYRSNSVFKFNFTTLCRYALNVVFVNLLVLIIILMVLALKDFFFFFEKEKKIHSNFPFFTKLQV